MISYLDVAYGAKPTNKMDVYLPDNDNFDYIVYFHGGGIESGDKAGDNCRGIAQDFVSAGYGFISANYSMYPEAKFPEFLFDCASAVGYAKKFAANLGGKKIYVSGQSAGAWMSLMLCLDAEYLSSVNISSAEIDGWIIDSAQTTAHFNVLVKEKGLGQYIQRIDEAAPLYYLSEKTNFSAMLLIYYENDMLCRPEQNKLFYVCLKANNPTCDAEITVLPGGHCHGSCVRDSSGNYPFVTTALEWLKKRETK